MSLLPLRALALAATLPLLAGAQQITSPPSLLQCLPASLTIQGGQAPYTVSVLPGGQVGAAPLETLPPVTAPGTVTWIVDLAEGTEVTFAVRDATGALGYSAPIRILPGSGDSCIGANSAATGSLVPTTTATTITDGGAAAASATTESSASETNASSAPQTTNTPESTGAPESTSAPPTSERPTSLPRPTILSTSATPAGTKGSTPSPATASPVQGTSESSGAAGMWPEGSVVLALVAALLACAA
ncbi:hypothetical protein JCM3770_000604 [Rhodotorula araucariae]